MGKNVAKVNIHFKMGNITKEILKMIYMKVMGYTNGQLKEGNIKVNSILEIWKEME